MEFWNYPDWKEETGLGSFQADEMDSLYYRGKFWVSKTVFTPSDELPLSYPFWAGFSMNYDETVVDAFVACAGEKKTDFPLVAFEDSPFMRTDTINAHFPFVAQFLSQEEAIDWLKLIVNSGGVTTDEIVRIARAEGERVKAHQEVELQNLHVNSAAESREGVQQKSGCAGLLILILSSGAIFVLIAMSRILF